MSKMLEKSVAPPRRVQIDFAESEIEEIEQLIDKCGLATKKDLFNNALTVLRWAIRQVESGYDVASIDREAEKFFVLTMPALEVARLKAPAKEKTAVHPPPRRVASTGSAEAQSKKHSKVSFA